MLKVEGEENKKIYSGTTQEGIYLPEGGTIFEAGNATDILGWGAPGTVDKAWIIDRGVGRDDGLDGDGMLPIVTKVIGVGECADIMLDQSAKLDVFCFEDRGSMIPFWIGNAIELVTDLEPEEVIIFEQHHRLDDLVQPLQARRQWDLDPAPD